MTDDPQYNGNGDEIDLRDIVLVLLEGWYWIVGVTVAAVVLAVAYLSVAEPSYSTDLRFTSAVNELNELNSMPSTNYSANDVKEEFRQWLGSYQNFRLFLEDEPEFRERLLSGVEDIDTMTTVEGDEILNRWFNNNLTFRNPGYPGDDEGPTRTLKLVYGENLEGPAFLNRYYEWTEARYIKRLVSRAKQTRDRMIARNNERMQAHVEAYDEDIASRIAQLLEKDAITRQDLEDDLAAEKQAHRDSLRARLRSLEEAASTAETLGIEKPTTPWGFGKQRKDGAQLVYAEVNANNGLPLYFMGTESLRAEQKTVQASLEKEPNTAAIRDLEKQLSQLKHNRQVEALKAREDVSRFIDEYVSLEEQNTLLRSNSVEPDDIEVAELLNPAFQPAGPDSPRKGLVLVLSVLLGGMLGVFSAFIARFVGSLLAYRDKSA